jgi:hypothetical protein
VGIVCLEYVLLKNAVTSPGSFGAEFSLSESGDTAIRFGVDGSLALSGSNRFRILSRGRVIVIIGRNDSGLSSMLLSEIKIRQTQDKRAEYKRSRAVAFLSYAALLLLIISLHQNSACKLVNCCVVPILRGDVCYPFNFTPRAMTLSSWDQMSAF